MAAAKSSAPRGRLATQLEEWAFVREKVLEKLDIRGARAARELAFRIREVILRMAEEASTQRSRSLGELRELCNEAGALLSDGPTRRVREVPVGQRPTLPVPAPHARVAPQPVLQRSVSGLHPTSHFPDLVKNHALRRRTGEH